MANSPWLASPMVWISFFLLKRAIGHKLFAIVGHSQKNTTFATWNNY